MTWLFSALIGAVECCLLWLLVGVIGRVVWYPRCAQRHFALLDAARAARSGQVGARELAFMRTHGLDPDRVAAAAPCLVAVSGAELAYVCRMLGRRSAASWTAAVITGPGARAALDVVHALPAFGRRGRRLRRVTGRLAHAAGRGERRRSGSARRPGWLRVVFCLVGGGAFAAVNPRRG